MVRIEDIVAEAMKLAGMKGENRKLVQMELEGLANDLWEYPWIFTIGTHTQSTSTSTRQVTLTGANNDISSIRGNIKYGDTNRPLEFVDDDRFDQETVGVVSAGYPSIYYVAGTSASGGLIIEMDSYGGENISYRYYKKVIEDIYKKFPDSFTSIFLNYMLFMFDDNPTRAEKALAMMDECFARRRIQHMYGSDRIPKSPQWRYSTTRWMRWAKNRKY